jgi:hypothetical protein
MGIVHHREHVRSTREVTKVNIGELDEGGVSSETDGRQNKQEDTDPQRPRLHPFPAGSADEENTLNEDGKQDSLESTLRRLLKSYNYSVYSPYPTPAMTRPFRFDSSMKRSTPFGRHSSLKGGAMVSAEGGMLQGWQLSDSQKEEYDTFL